MTTIFKSAEGRARLEAWYERFLAHVEVPIAHHQVPTSCGPSHVLALGNPNHPPLLALHGALASSAHLALEMGPLLDRYHVLAPDIPGQSVRGPEVRLGLADAAHAHWLVEVMDGLGLATADILGVSWGGFVTLDTMAHAPERVARAVLLVPAGVVSGSAWRGITRAAIPMALYKAKPSKERLKRFLDSQLTVWDELWASYLGDALLDVALDLHAPPLFKPAQLSAFRRPVLALGASDDLSFPGDKLVARVRELLPQAETELLAGCKHVPPTNHAFRCWLAERTSGFLAGALAPRKPASDYASDAR